MRVTKLQIEMLCELTKHHFCQACLRTLCSALVIRPRSIALAGMLAYIMCSLPTIAQDQLVEMKLLELTLNKEAAAIMDVPSMRDAVESTSAELWPIAEFLFAEALLAGQYKQKAASQYLALITAHSDPTRDPDETNSGLFVVALWRLAGLLLEHECLPKENCETLLDRGDGILRLNSTRRMFASGISAALPSLQESLFFRLFSIAQKLGDQQRTAQYYRSYIGSTSEVTLPRSIQIFTDRQFADGKMTPESFRLSRAESMHKLGYFDKASELLLPVIRAEDKKVIGPAYITDALLRQARGDPDRDVLYPLNQIVRNKNNVAPLIVEKALYMRAIIRKKQGKQRLFERDMREIESKFAGTPYFDDALIELARHYQMSGDYERALAYFRKSLAHRQNNEWLQTARLHMGLTFFLRWRQQGDAKDRINAGEQFEHLLDESVEGTLMHRAAQFWLARLLQEAGGKQDAAKAMERFRNLERNYSNSYYGIRSAMYIAMMESAGGDPPGHRFLPDVQLMLSVKEKFDRSHILSIPDKVAEAMSFKRLSAAIESGLYGRAKAVEQRSREKSRDIRLQDKTPEELDRAGTLSAMTLFLALRIDARATKERFSTPRTTLAIIGFLMQATNDIAFAISLLPDREPSVREHEGYLRTAYPAVFHRDLLEVTKGDSFLASVLYAIVRYESLFDETAMSSRSAYGLMQITQGRFDELDQAYNLLAKTTFNSYRSLLLNPTENLRIGGVHFIEDILNREIETQRIPLALMEHNAGAESVAHWMTSWKILGIDDDIEFMIETARARASRNFVRSAYSTIVIVYSSGMFERQGQHND